MTTRRSMFGRINKRRKTALASLEKRLNANPDWWKTRNPSASSEVVVGARKLAEAEANTLGLRIK